MEGQSFARSFGTSFRHLLLSKSKIQKKKRKWTEWWRMRRSKWKIVIAYVGSLSVIPISFTKIFKWYSDVRDAQWCTTFRNFQTNQDHIHTAHFKRMLLLFIFLLSKQLERKVRKTVSKEGETIEKIEMGMRALVTLANSNRMYLMFFIWSCETIATADGRNWCSIHTYYLLSED